MFGRGKADSGASIAHPTTPARKTPQDIPQAPKRKGSAAVPNPTMLSMTAQASNSVLTSPDREMGSLQMDISRSSLHIPHTITSNSDTRAVPNNIETTPLAYREIGRISCGSTDTYPVADDEKPERTPTTCDASQVSGNSGHEDGKTDGGAVTPPKSNETDTNGSDTESDTDEAGPSTQHYRKESSSDSDNAPSGSGGNQPYSSSHCGGAKPQGPPAPSTPHHRRLTADRAAYTERMVAVRKIETVQKGGKAAEANKDVGKGKKTEAKSQDSVSLRSGENLRPVGNNSNLPAPSPPQPKDRQHQGHTVSRFPTQQFVLGLEDDPFYDADLEDAMQTASRELATESLLSTENTLFANTRNELLKAFNSPSNITTPSSEAFHQSCSPSSQGQTSNDSNHQTQHAVMVANRVRENRYFTENHRRLLAGQEPLTCLHDEKAPRSGPSPPSAFRARTHTGGLFLRAITPTLSRQRIDLMAASPPVSPTPVGTGGPWRSEEEMDGGGN